MVNSYYQNIYIKPYTRIGPYIIGMLMAYFIFRLGPERKFRLSAWVVSFGWFLSIGTLLAIVLVMYPANNGHPPGAALAGFYSSTSRILWSLALAWMTFAAYIKRGGFIDAFLALKVWIPFSRLTFCAYLVHPILIAIFYGTRRQTFDYSFYLMVSTCWMLFCLRTSSPLTLLGPSSTSPSATSASPTWSPSSSPSSWSTRSWHSPESSCVGPRSPSTLSLLVHLYSPYHHHHHHYHFRRHTTLCSR